MTSSVFAPFAKSVENGHTLVMRVDGMRCAKCMFAVESALKKQPTVTEARVNLSTSRVTVAWSGEAEQAEKLAGAVENLGYKVAPISKSSGDVAPAGEEDNLLRCMAVAGFAMGNVMLISVALWTTDAQTMGQATRELLHFLSAFIALPTVLYAGRPFFASAYRALSRGHTNMDVPISVGVTLACVTSAFETFSGGEHAYFDSAVMLLFFLLTGRWLDAKARGKAGRHARDLLEMLQGTATLFEDGKTRIIEKSELKAGDVVMVAAGEKAPADAEILSGSSDVDASLVTGESAPRAAGPGDVVYGGCVNLSAPLVCRVLQPNEDSVLAEAVRLMETAEQGRARYVRLADKAAKLYTPVVHALAAASFVGWYFWGDVDWQRALTVSVTTLIITCPCALGLAAPAVQVLATEWLMKRGVLVKSGDALERLTGVDAVIFDKTGTLTLGRPALLNADAIPSERLLLAAALADHSRHPLSRAISEAARGERPILSDVKETAGMGVEGFYQEKKVFLGKNDAASGAALYEDGEKRAEFFFSDPMREGARETVEAFAKQGMATYLVSGDKKESTESMANALGIERCFAETLPGEKVVVVKKLQDEGRRVFMIGDGLNDAPALTQANVSMAPSDGMDVTQNAADAVFCGASLNAVIMAVRMAKFSTTLVKQNFTLAVLYNCVAVPLALAGWVTPLVAALAMSSSSIIVVANAFRVRRF
ncbi:MAG: heavy metal translocating P-type ATPase [Rickettsiales bacterium]